MDYFNPVSNEFTINMFRNFHGKLSSVLILTYNSFKEYTHIDVVSKDCSQDLLTKTIYSTFITSSTIIYFTMFTFSTPPLGPKLILATKCLKLKKSNRKTVPLNAIFSQIGL